MARKKAPENTAALSKDHDAICAYLTAKVTRERLAEHLFKAHGPSDPTLTAPVMVTDKDEPVFKEYSSYDNKWRWFLPGPGNGIAYKGVVSEGEEKLVGISLDTTTEYPVAAKRGRGTAVIGYADIYATLSVQTNYRTERMRFLIEVKSGAFSPGEVLRQIKYYADSLAPRPLCYLVAPVIAPGVAAQLLDEGVHCLTVGQDFRAWQSLYPVVAVAEI